MEINDLPGYYIYKNGRVWSGRLQRFLPVSLDGKGYQKVSIRFNKTTVNRTIHRLMAIHFIPNPNNLPQVNHKDGNKLNNNLDNLEWCTAQYNTKHSRDVLGRCVGTLNGRCVLTPNQVVEIFLSPLGPKVLSERFGITPGTVCHIKAKRIWKSVLIKL